MTRCYALIPVAALCLLLTLGCEPREIFRNPNTASAGPAPQVASATGTESAGEPAATDAAPAEPCTDTYCPAPGSEKASAGFGSAGADYLKSSAVKADLETEGPTAVESALKWSEKYSLTAEKLVALQQQYRELDEQRKTVEKENAKLRAELKQTETELTDANEMLVDMRRSVQKWKQQVLGLQGENRRTLQAIVVSQKKILELLGGEVPEESRVAGTSAESTDG